MTMLWVAAAILAVGAGLALGLRDNRHRGLVAIGTQAAASALVLATVLPVLLGGGDLRASVAWSFPIDVIAVHLDPLGAFFLAWSLPMTLLGTIYALGYLEPWFRTRNAGVQFALLNVTSLSFLMIYTLESGFVFLLGWEIAAVAAWLLVVWDYRNQKIRFAGFNYLVSTHIGLFFLLAGFMVMHSQTGSLDFQAFGTFLRSPTPLRDVTFVLLATAFGLKSAFFPFHTWLPRAHSAAPAHVSALMSGVIHKAGLFGLLRIILLMGTPEAWMGWYVLSCSALSAVVGVLYTTAQRDLKRLLGYSSTENVGIAGVGFGLGMLGLAWHQPALAALGFTGGILHLLNHALFKCLLFYAAGAVYRATHTVDLERLGGLTRRMPWTAGFFLVGGLAISALPPLNGFVSELLIYAGLLDQAAAPGLERALLIVGAAVLAFAGGVSALAMVRAFGTAFLGAPRDREIHCDGEVPLSMRLPMALHALGCVALGLVPGIGLALVERPAGLFLVPLGLPGSLAGAGAAALLAPVAGLGALGVAVLAALAGLRWWLLRGGPSPVHVTWGCGYGAPTPRMQYTATSFSAQFAGIFRTVLRTLRRERLPVGPFPGKGDHLNTHCVDAVEQRLFEVMGEGDGLVVRLAHRIPIEPRFSLAAGLVVLLVVVSLVVSMTGGGR
jgi:hydrogenase-4 component B